MKWMGVWLILAVFAVQANEPGDYSARAVVKAQQRAVLSAEQAGVVKKLPFRIGDRFNQGQTLVGLDCRLYQAQQQRIDAQLKGAQQKMESARKLQQLHSIGAIELATTEAEYEQSRALAKIAKLNSERCQIIAPWNGRVVAVLTRAHESVKAQQQLIEIINDQQLLAEAVVPAAWLTWLKTGAKVELISDELQRRETVHIRAISPAIDLVSQTLEVELTLPVHSQLIAGASVRAVFSPPAEMVVAVPLATAPELSSSNTTTEPE